MLVMVIRFAGECFHSFLGFSFGFSQTVFIMFEIFPRLFRCENFSGPSVNGRPGVQMGTG